jgi:hypothetical protein
VTELAITLPVHYVRIPVFCTVTGYTPDAVDKKIKRGVWREGIHFRRAPDGHILIDLRAYHAWVENQNLAA